MMIALIGINANAAVYIVGDAPFGGWNPGAGVEMTLDNGVYTYKATITGSVWFVFGTNLDADWNVFNPNYRIGPTNGDETVEAGVEYTTQMAGGDHGAYKFTGSGEEYTITFDEANMKFKVEGYVEPVTEFTYTVAGSSTDLFGTAWDEDNTDNDMTLVNGLYTFTKNNVELTTAGFSFKVVENHDWGTAYPSSNYVQAIGTHGYYNVVITFNKDTKEITCTPTLVEEIIDEEDPIYTVAGTPAALFGTEWAPSLTENEMTKGQDGIYTWSKQNVALTAGDVQFKVVLGHDWGVEYPSSNYVATIDANGNYDVTITFNPENQEITFAATLVEETEDFYTVAGAPASIFGVEWTPSYADNNMTLVDGLYTWTKENVEIAAETVIEFKVVKNNNWSTCWPADNYTYTVAEDGTYNLTITYNPENDVVLLNCEKAGDEPIEITSYTVAGPEAIFGSDWDATDTTNDMVLNQETGLYTWTKTGVELTESFGFKVVGNHDWANEWPQGYDNNWIVNIEEAGKYDLVITFNAENGEINCTASKVEEPAVVRGDVDGNGSVTIDDVTTLIDILLSGAEAPAGADCDLNGAVTIDDVTSLIDYLLSGNWPAVEMVYTVVGPVDIFGSNWNPADDANNMVGANGIYTWTKRGVTLYGNFEFKVVGNHDYAVYEWPIGNNWVANVAEEGVYDIVITFNPEAADAERITCSLTKTGDVGPVEHTYTVAGTKNLLGSDWNTADTANDMVKGEDGIYTWTRELVTFNAEDVVEFKVVQDHAWTYAWPSSNWWWQCTEAGNYDVVITFNPAADDMNKITFTATKLATIDE